MHFPLLLVLWLQFTTLGLATPDPSRHRASDIVEINQTINLFAVLVDTSQYDQLGRVFTPDATVNFNLPNGSILHGLSAITKLLSGLANVSGQHDITTQYVDLLGPSTANATTYFVGNFFGVKAQAGQIFTEYGKYETEMVLTRDGWRVDYLTLITVAQFGNLSIVFPNGPGS